MLLGSGQGCSITWLRFMIIYPHLKQYSFAKSQGRNLSDNWEGCLFIYSCYAQQISFEINLNSKEIRRAGHEYMNKHPPPELAF